MRKPAWLERMDQSFGFHEDERVRQLHGSAVRAAYIAMLVATLPLGAFQAYVLQQRGAVWATLLILAASLLVLSVRRVQLNGFGAADERMIRARQSMFFWPMFTLLLGMVVYATYLLLIGADGRSIMMVGLYNMIGPIVILLTRALNGTAQGHLWFWILLAVWAFGWFISGASIIINILLVDQQAGVPLPTINDMLPLLLILMPAFAFGIVCGLAAWRSWQQRA